ncbi:MAG: hypothetical protein NTZ69_05285 [Bacteroidia bacterium]|nr:hypothetical protein [Bacteroidia bacterium]
METFPGVVIEPHLQPVADLSIQAHIDFLVKIESGIALHSGWNSWIFYFVAFQSHAHLYITLRTDVHNTAAEDFVEGISANLKLRNNLSAAIEGLLRNFFPPIAVDGLFQVALNELMQAQRSG